MVATTRIITKEDALNSVKKRRGRPTVLDTAELIAGAQKGQSYREAVNQKYAIDGLAFASATIGDEQTTDVFLVGERIRYQGCWEQLGRMVRSELFSFDELEGITYDILNEIKNGNNCRSIERTLRLIRMYVANGGSLDDE